MQQPDCFLTVFSYLLADLVDVCAQTCDQYALDDCRKDSHGDLLSRLERTDCQNPQGTDGNADPAKDQRNKIVFYFLGPLQSHAD